MPLSRRSILAGLANFLGVGSALSATKRKKPLPKLHKLKAGHSNANQHPARLPPTPIAKLTGNTVPIPPLIEPKAGTTWHLTADTATHAFAPGLKGAVATYNDCYPGPTVRLHRGEVTHFRLINNLPRASNLHWHGLIVDPSSDAALISVPSGHSWETTLKIDQPAATLWYHERVFNGGPPRERPCGLLLITDPESSSVGLPSNYGVDDFPLILDDHTFEPPGSQSPSLNDALFGTRGATILVNGVADALLKVPQRLVRLRIVNAARARVFRLFMDDERSFWIVAGDGGFLPAPFETDTLIIAPGERSEIIVDFADGSTSLMSTPDDVDVFADISGVTTPRHIDKFEKPFRVLAFETQKDADVSKTLPTLLPDAALSDTPPNAIHRRFEFAVASDGLTSSINGKTFDPIRVDVAAKSNTAEIWQLIAVDIPRPVHITGAQFRVLSEDGESPSPWNRSAKDTVFVWNTVDIQVTFTRTSAVSQPFLVESAEPEQAGKGAVATIVVVG